MGRDAIAAAAIAAHFSVPLISLDDRVVCFNPKRQGVYMVVKLALFADAKFFLRSETNGPGWGFEAFRNEFELAAPLGGPAATPASEAENSSNCTEAPGNCSEKG